MTGESPDPRDLVERLSAELDRLEALARAAQRVWVDGGYYCYGEGKEDVDAHIEANEPDVVLRTIQAHREILRHHAKVPAKKHPGYDCDWCGYPYPCFDVQNVASIYFPESDGDPT